MTHIYLYGPPGSGKSTIGRLVAERLKMPFVDLDATIEAQAALAIPAIFTQRGESAFRDLESTALRQTAGGAPAVVALGGGALLRPENRELAERTGYVLCLEADYETLAGRIKEAPNGVRPLLTPDANDVAPLAKLLQTRIAHYASFSRRVTVTNAPATITATHVQSVLGLYQISGMGNDYRIITGDPLLETLPTHLKDLAGSRRTIIVGDTNTMPLYGARYAAHLRSHGIECAEATIPAGETTKDINTVQTLWSAFLAAGIERGSLVIAIGGGVVGDLTGFAAATWLRGVRWIGVPTTLLAMVDSSMGGKTGADLPNGKNLIGAFHPPALVLADTSALRTLPVCELRCGLAEVIKHAIIDDPTLLTDLQHFTFLKELGENECCPTLPPANWLNTFVARAMAVKVRIIQEDPFERGRRAALNLGHTIGHGIEKATAFRVRHGEAVAIGTVLEARVAELMGLAPNGLAAQIADHFYSVGLPTTLPPDIDLPAVLEAITLDKKRAHGQVLFALPTAIGEVRTGQPVAAETLNHVLQFATC